MREKKFQFVFQHPESKEVIISGAYCLNSIMGVSIDEIQETVCDCDCQPLGESSYKDCNCDEYYMAFVAIADREYTGLTDKNKKEIYEGDVVKYYPTYPKGDSKIYRIGVVYWQDFRSGWATTRTEFSNNDLFRCVQYGNELEVIGNIHQNPELLA